MDGLLRHFTTDPRAVRAGVTRVTGQPLRSYSRGAVATHPVQQAGVTGVSVTAYYALGAATTWATISSAAAGTPGSRPGPRARLVAAAGIGRRQDRRAVDAGRPAPRASKGGIAWSGETARWWVWPAGW